VKNHHDTGCLGTHHQRLDLQRFRFTGARMKGILPIQPTTTASPSPRVQVPMPSATPLYRQRRPSGFVRGLSSAYTSEFILNQFDVAGNLVSAQHNSTLNGTVTTWTTANYSYDGLNRMTSKVDRDNATTTYAYDPMND
jgi:hypothetical protein